MTVLVIKVGWLDGLAVRKACSRGIRRIPLAGDYLKFCEVLGFEPSDYAEDKYREFQDLISNLNKFDLQAITKVVEEGTRK